VQVLSGTVVKSQNAPNVDNTAQVVRLCHVSFVFPDLASLLVAQTRDSIPDTTW
jgi:hypothetical protein